MKDVAHIFLSSPRKILNLLGNDNKHIIFNVSYILFLLPLLGNIVIGLLKTSWADKSWAITDFLINYQNGFVRRGLTGEILLFFAKYFDINVLLTIKIFCLVCLTLVCIFFVNSFIKKGYSLYVLPLCFFLGGNIFSYDWLRKDYMFFCFFISILWLYKCNLPVLIKVVTINVLIAFVILSHEIFAFFSIPMIFLMFFNGYKNKGVMKSLVLSFLCLMPSILAFFLVLLMHGNPETAQAIWNSWTAILGLDPQNIAMAVDAIGWTSEFAARLHFRNNFFSISSIGSSFDSIGVSSLIVWGITFPVVYYIATNALLTFRKNKDIFTDKHKTILSSVLIFQLLSLSPVFLVLSCDYHRIFFFWIASSFTVFLLIPIDNIEKLFHKKIISLIERINRIFTGILQPSKTNLVFLMLFIGISPSHFHIHNAVRTSLLYNVLLVLSQPFVFIGKILFGG